MILSAASGPSSGHISDWLWIAIGIVALLGLLSILCPIATD